MDTKKSPRMAGSTDIIHGLLLSAIGPVGTGRCGGRFKRAVLGLFFPCLVAAADAAMNRPGNARRNSCKRVMIVRPEIRAAAKELFISSKSPYFALRGLSTHGNDPGMRDQPPPPPAYGLDDPNVASSHLGQSAQLVDPLVSLGYLQVHLKGPTGLLSAG